MFHFHESTVIRLFENNNIEKIINIDFNTYLAVDLSIPMNTKKKNINLIDLFKNKYLYSSENSIDIDENPNTDEINEEKKVKIKIKKNLALKL